MTPAQRFRKYNKEDATQLAIAVHEPWFLSAVSATLAEMAHRNQTESILGANAFIETFTQLHEDAPKVNLHPDPNLASYQVPIAFPKTEPETSPS